MPHRKANLDTWRTDPGLARTDGSSSSPSPGLFMDFSTVRPFLTCLATAPTHPLRMIRFFLLCGLAILSLLPRARADVLIVADEFPAMQLLAGKLKAEE